MRLGRNLDGALQGKAFNFNGATRHWLIGRSSGLGWPYRFEDDDKQRAGY
jgi:hypothetical protein